MSPVVEAITINYDSLEIEANAGADEIVVAGRSITLDGSESIGLGLDYVWTVFSGEGTLTDATTSTPTFSVDANASTGETTIVLTVFDDFDQKSTDSLTINIISDSNTDLAPEDRSGSHGTLLINESETTNDSGASQIVLSLGDNSEIYLPSSLSDYTYDVSVDNTLVIGVPGDDNSTGAVYIFHDDIDLLTGSFDLDESSSDDWTKICLLYTSDAADES